MKQLRFVNVQNTHTEHNTVNHTIVKLTYYYVCPRSPIQTMPILNCLEYIQLIVGNFVTMSDSQ